MSKWDKRYLELAREVSTWSKDPSTKVGAVLVDLAGLVVGTGYNGFPRGVSDDPERYENRELKYQLVVHAEANAIICAGHRAKNCTLYVYPSFMLPPVCSECCKLAIQAGVWEIVGYVPDESDERVKRWADSIKISRMMCEEANILYRGV